MYKKGDFHIHTNISDGGFSPEEVVNIAKEYHYDVISITDHDNIDGVSRAINEGEKIGVKVIPGIEFSTIHNKESIHILGYFKDESYKGECFNKYLKDIQEYRMCRGKQIVDNLKKFFDIELDYNEIIKETKGVIARPHIAKAIIESGYKYNWEFIFNKILSKQSPAYVPNKNISIEEGIKILKNLNAEVVLAHPVLIKNTSIDDIIKFPFDGIEAIYPLNKKEDEDKFIKKAKEYNKFITAGSDFHGLKDEDNSHGKLGDVELKGEYLKIFLKNLKI